MEEVLARFFIVPLGMVRLEVRTVAVLGVDCEGKMRLVGRDEKKQRERSGNALISSQYVASISLLLALSSLIFFLSFSVCLSKHCRGIGKDEETKSTPGEQEKEIGRTRPSDSISSSALGSPSSFL
jgi:hypothetical protein